MARLDEPPYRIESIAMCGGGTKNPLFVREHADATGCEVVLGREPEAVLLGSAMLGAVSAGDRATLDEAMAAMSGAGARHFPVPAGSDLARFYAAKHRVFLRMHDDQVAYRELMRG